MMDVLRFIGTDGAHFMGTLVLMVVFFWGLTSVIYALRGKRDE